MQKIRMIKDSSAVSPVIGVMLMIVVTVILAAAVSSYSNGMMTNAKVAPAGAFDVEIAKDIDANMNNVDSMSYISIRQITGDPIKTGDLKIVTINPQARGEYQVREVLPHVANTHTPYYTGAMPIWNVGKLINSSSEDTFFGDYTLEPGKRMLADGYSNYKQNVEWNPDEGRYEYNGFPADPEDPNCYIDGMQAMFADWDNVKSGDFVTVKFVHIPTGKVIFDTEVRVI